MNASSASHPSIPSPSHLISVQSADDEFLRPFSSSSLSSSDSPPSEAEFQDLVERYPFAAEATYFTRPNRYHGPASTWRAWTADDRVVADAIDQDRAQNLSIHLYNAFALRKTARVSKAHESEPRSPLRSNSNDENLNTTTGLNIDETAQQIFLPPRLWTAWPLRGWDVPRRHRDGQSVTGHCTTNSTPPGKNLEETLIAISLKNAKEKWYTRESGSIPQTNSRKKRNWKIERELTIKQLIDSRTVQQDDSIEQEPQNMDATVMSLPDSPDNQDSAESDVEAPGGMPTFSSQAFHLESSSESASEDLQSKSENNDYEPVFSADDDEARRMLMPSTRHVLSKLDDLLLALHKARKAYASRDPNRDVSTSVSVSTSMSGSRARSAEAPTDTDAVGKEDQYLRTGTFRSRTKRLRQERDRGRKRQRSPPVEPSHSSLGLRDWSDIIGMATLTGWNTETVARAAERCARLFNENMMFRTFHDSTSPWTSDKTGTSLATYDEEYAYVPHGTKETDDDSDAMLVDSEPASRYIRSSSPCTHCQTHNLRCDPPMPSTNSEAQLSTNSTSRVSCAGCTMSQNPSSCSGIGIKLATQSINPPLISRACPHPNCPRHSQPFKKRYHLERHIRDVHHGNNTISNFTTDVPLRTQRSVPMIVRTKPTTALEAEHEMEGAAAARTGLELTCPVPTCQRHMHNYSRPTRLYAHIKREHPEVNLLRFKGLVGQRGESRRGKYDRSKTRSQSQSGSRSHSLSQADGAAVHVRTGEEIRGAWQEAGGEEDDEDEDEDEDADEDEEVEDEEVDETAADVYDNYAVVEMTNHDEDAGRHRNMKRNKNADEDTTRVDCHSDVESDYIPVEQSDDE